MKSILVTSGQVDQQALTMLRAAGGNPDMVAKSMAEAAEWILADAAAQAARRVSLDERTLTNSPGSALTVLVVGNEYPLSQARRHRR